MKVHTNHALVRRRIRISLVYLFTSLAFLLGGFFLSSAQQDLTMQYLVSMPTLVVGLVLWARHQTQIARWGPRSRQDSVLARALRGLDDRYYLLVFPRAALPDYLLLGPMGIVVLVPRAVAGTVRCFDDRWRHEEGRPLLLRLFLWFAHRPTLGDPTTDAQRGIRATYGYANSRLAPEIQERLRVDAAVVFTHPQVNLTLHGCAVPSLLLKSLRGHIRRMPKSLNPTELASVLAAFPPS